VVESSGLLNRRRVKNSTGGSNPPLSASPIVSITSGDRFGRFARSGRLASFCYPNVTRGSSTDVRDPIGTAQATGLKTRVRGCAGWYWLVTVITDSGQRTPPIRPSPVI
jgi:hypothetical protein